MTDIIKILFFYDDFISISFILFKDVFDLLTNVNAQLNIIRLLTMIVDCLQQL